MNAKVGIAVKQRIREVTWKSMKEKQIQNTRYEIDDIFSRRLQQYYRDSYMLLEDSGVYSCMLIRGKGILEIQTRQLRDKVKIYMKQHNLPGGQITIKTYEEATIEWFCWYDGYIFSDGDVETIAEDPVEARTFSLDDETKEYLKDAISAGLKNKNGGSVTDTIYKSLRDTFKNTYKNYYITQNLMPKVTIHEMCVIDITNRNRGYVMAFDVQQMKQYMNEMLIPGVLINFSDGVLTSFVWFSVKNSKVEMTIEILNEMPPDLDLDIDSKVKNKIRESVIEIHKDRTLHEEKEIKIAIIESLKNEFSNVYKDKYQDGHMPDITVDNDCIIDVRKRNRGILMNKDRFSMKSSMIDLNMPAAQINFIDNTSAVILWFCSSKGNMNIDLEAQGESITGAKLGDFI